MMIAARMDVSCRYQYSREEGRYDSYDQQSTRKRTNLSENLRHSRKLALCEVGLQPKELEAR